MSINNVNISGNLTRDAEKRTAKNGTPVLAFSVAVNERRHNQNGEWDTYTNFFDCTMFGKRADALAQYLTKGTKVSIEGHLHYSSWETKDGGRRSKVGIIADEIEFMSSRNGKAAAEVAAAADDVPEPAYAEEDIPF